MNIHLETKRLKILPIDKSNYENVTKMFINNEEYGCATGVFEVISQKEVETRISLDDYTDTGFILAAQVIKPERFAGYLKGRIFENNNGVWIYTFMIESEIRRKGYGREFINEVIDYLRECHNTSFFSLSVLEDNIIAKMFWLSLGFQFYETLIKPGVIGGQTSRVNIFVKKF